MTRIFLLSPPSPLTFDRTHPVRQVMNTLPSLGICYLGGVLRKAGSEVSLLDASAYGCAVEECVDHILNWQPDILGISTFTSSIHLVRAIVTRIKATQPGVTVILGGPHITAVHKRMNDLDTFFDVAVIGEGEASLLDLVQSIETGNNLSTVAGLMIKIGNKWQYTGPRQPLNLDELPLPAWDLLPEFPQHYQPPIFSYTQGPGAPLITSRGCPYHCGFCDHSVFGYRYRTHSVKYVIEMVQHLKTNFRINHILFFDDHLSLDKKRLHSICEQLIQTESNINWTADVRADSLTVDDLIIMKRAGCVRINCGLETGSRELLQAMNKKLDLVKAEQTLNLAHILNIQTKGLFMLGYPGENKESVKNTINFVKRLTLTEINLTKFAPYPGTIFYKEFLGDRNEKSFWKLLDGLHFCELNQRYNTWLERKYRLILHSFYSRPRIIFNYLRLILRMHESRKRLVSFFVALLLMLIKPKSSRT